jgi:hypothetical protein
MVLEHEENYIHNFYVFYNLFGIYFKQQFIRSVEINKDFQKKRVAGQIGADPGSTLPGRPISGSAVLMGGRSGTL